MKQLIFSRNLHSTLPILIFLQLLCIPLWSQIKLGNNVTNIHPKVLLEMESDSHGVLLPRMTTAQRDAAFNSDIPDGLLIYNTENQCLQIWYGQSQRWQCINSQDAIDSSTTFFLTKDHQLILKNYGTVDLSPYVNQEQQLSLEEDLIKLDRGGSINLKDYIAKTFKTGIKTNTDSQTLHLDETTNRLSLDNGGDVDLSKYLDAVIAKVQQIDEFEIRSGKLYLSLAGDGQASQSVVLPQANTDSQTLRLTANTNKLTLDHGGEVDLSKYLDDTNTDSQTLSLKGDILSISGTTSTVNLSKYATTNTQTLRLTIAGAVTKTALEIKQGNAISLVASNGLKFQTTSTTLMIIGSGVGSGSDNLYNDDGVLASDRSVDLANNKLSFNNNDIFVNGLTVGRGGSNQVFNVALGTNALLSNTNNGRHNSALGASALKSNTLGSFNTAIGGSALKKNQVGDGNIAIGINALINNVSGNNNTVVGADSAKNITTGNSNTILGSKVSGLASNTMRNIIIADGEGNQRLRILGNGYVGLGDIDPAYKLSLHAGTSTATSARTIAIQNTPVIYLPDQDTNKFKFSLAIGNGLRNLIATSKNFGKNNTAVGMEALLKNTTGFQNTAFGAKAMRNNLTGRSNSAFGEDALFFNTTGTSNTAFGDTALKNNNTGSRNTAVGTGANRKNISGNGNTVIGFQTLRENTTGSFNVVIGSNSLSNVSTSSFNTIIGWNTGEGIISGSNNTIIGARVSSNTSNISNISNNVIIADGEGNQRIRILANGNVGLGTQTPTFDLTVNGSIGLEGETTASIHPDYVFDIYYKRGLKWNPNYRLRSLKEMETFIKINLHLPGVQSCKDIIKNKGWDVSENVRTNLEKVEELFLYTIEQQKKIDQQHQAISLLKSELSQLKKSVKALLHAKQ